MLHYLPKHFELPMHKMWYTNKLNQNHFLPLGKHENPTSALSERHYLPPQFNLPQTSRLCSGLLGCMLLIHPYNNKHLQTHLRPEPAAAAEAWERPWSFRCCLLLSARIDKQWVIYTCWHGNKVWTYCKETTDIYLNFITCQEEIKGSLFDSQHAGDLCSDW